MSEPELEITQLHASICKGLADPKRLLIINALRDGELAVMDLCETLGLPQANVSQHLSVLREKDLLRTRKEAQKVFYSITSPKIIQAMDLLREVMSELMPAEFASYTSCISPQWRAVFSMPLGGSILGGLCQPALRLRRTSQSAASVLET